MSVLRQVRDLLAAPKNPGLTYSKIDFGKMDSCNNNVALFAVAVRLLAVTDDPALAAEFTAALCGPSSPPTPPLLAALALLVGSQDTSGGGVLVGGGCGGGGVGCDSGGKGGGRERGSKGGRGGEGEGKAKGEGEGLCVWKETVEVTFVEETQAAEASPGAKVAITGWLLELPGELQAAVQAELDVPAEVMAQQLLRAVSSR